VTSQSRSGVCLAVHWLVGGLLIFFFFSSRRRHTRLVSDWSSDVCSSDLHGGGHAGQGTATGRVCLVRLLRRRQRRWRGGDGQSRSEERRVGKEGRCVGGRRR